MAAQPARGVQIEKHRAAAEERLDIAVEGRRIKPAEMGKELTFPAGPFQQGPNLATWRLGDLVSADSPSR